MPPTGAGGDPTAVIACRCGKTLRLPGARPGRVGKCPGCGATFRVPEAGLPPAADGGTVAPPVVEPSAFRPGSPPVARQPRPGPKPRPKPQPRPDLDDEPEAESNPAGAGYALTPDTSAFAPSTFPESPRRRRERPETAESEGESTLVPSARRPRRDAPRDRDREPIKPIGRGGILPLPDEPERSALGSLLYPLWDGQGLAAMVLLPLGLLAPSMIVFLLIPIVLGGGAMALFGGIAFGFLGVFLIAMGYLLEWWTAVLIASAQGDVHHPRWPEPDIGSILLTLVRWSLAAAPGLLLMALPAQAFREAAGSGLGATMATVAILAGGGLYSLMALLSVVMHDDLTAIGPGRVLPAIFKIGRGYLAAVAATVATAAVVTLVFAGARRLPMFWPLIFGFLGAWVVTVYLGMVVMRILGRSYHRKAKKVGWFIARRKAKRDRPDQADGDGNPIGPLDPRVPTGMPEDDVLP